MLDSKIHLASQIQDNRKRCPGCNMLAPQHRKWCITPVMQGEKVVETQEIEGMQSAVLEVEAQGG